MATLFQELTPNIADNGALRIPQRDGFDHIRNYFSTGTEEREVGVVLPVGCGKSGLICLSPFATRAQRVLVVAPQVRVAQQLHRDFDPTAGDKFFYLKRDVLSAPPYPEPVEIRGTTTNLGDLDIADVVITNIDQLQGAENRWLTQLPPEYFDLILFDEGHHAVAQSWSVLRETFPDARIVNFSATPCRADGQLMPGRIIYSYPVRDAIAQGYVKRLKALVLNPATLRYVRHEDDQEVEVGLEEVRRLGEEDAGFRRSIVSSKETLTTIIDSSIRELQRIRSETGDERHKIIAAALNFRHCNQIVEAYRARGLRADFVHSRESQRSDDVLARFEQHELDVIVQVRKLGEGFDHPYLSVAAVCSIFANLSPFVQFVGRIMRVVDPSDRESPQNQGTVVFHAGGNIAQRWDDFRDFSEADQEFFDQLLPLESLDFSGGDEIGIDPQAATQQDQTEVRGQTGVTVQEIPLLQNEEAMQHIRALQEQGITLEDIRQVFEHQPVPTTRVRERQAARSALDNEVRRLAGQMIAQHALSYEGQDLDAKRLGRSNFEVIKARIDNIVRERVANKDRSDYTAEELARARSELPSIYEQIERELF